MLPGTHHRKMNPLHSGILFIELTHVAEFKTAMSGLARLNILSVCAVLLLRMPYPLLMKIWALIPALQRLGLTMKKTWTSRNEMWYDILWNGMSCDDLAR